MKPHLKHPAVGLAALLFAAAPAAHADGFEFQRRAGSRAAERQSLLHRRRRGRRVHGHLHHHRGRARHELRRVLRQHHAVDRADAGSGRPGRPDGRRRPEFRGGGREPDLPGPRPRRRGADPRLRARRPAPVRRQVRPALLARLRRGPRRVRHGHVRGHQRDRRDGRRGLRLRLRRRGAPVHPVRQRVHGRHQRPQRLHGQQARADARGGRRPGQHRQHGILRAGARHRARRTCWCTWARCR